MNDQAALLRRMVGSQEDRPAPVDRSGGAAPLLDRAAGDAPPLRMARSGATAIAITSGKGGVGKSNLSVNLAIALARHGQRVALVDADLGLANADVLCGVQPLATLEQCLSLRRPLLECAVEVSSGFHLVPGASGVARLADMDPSDRSWLLGELASLAAGHDWLIIDTGAGIGANTVSFAAAADRVLVVTTPEPPSMADAYGMIKTLAPRTEPRTVELVVNQARDDEDAQGVWMRLDRVSRAFLTRSLPLAGWIPHDPSLPQAVRRRIPLLRQSPGCPSARRILRLAERLVEGDARCSPTTGSKGADAAAGAGARWGGASAEGQNHRANARGGFLGRLSRLLVGASDG